MKNLFPKSVAVLAAAIPTYLIRLNIGGVPTNVFEILLIGLLSIGLCFPSERLRWRQAEQSLPRPVFYVVSLWIVAALISATISDVPRVSFGIFKSWVIVPIFMGWLVYASGERVARWLLFSGVIVSLLSLTQFVWGDRLSGIYDVPNSLALYLAPLIVMTVIGGGLKARYLAAAFAMFVTLLLTQSVAGVIAILLVASVSLYLLHKTKSTNAKQNQIHSTQSLKFVLLSLVGIGVVSLVFLLHTGRLAYIVQPATSGQANSVSVRLQLWSISWELIKEHPVLGIGLGQFEPAYQQKLHNRFVAYNLQSTIYNLQPPLPEFVFRDPHNWMLSFWLNTGLLGLVSFISLHILAFKQLTPATAALATLLIFGLVDTLYWKNDLSALHWVLLALALKEWPTVPAAEAVKYAAQPHS